MKNIPFQVLAFIMAVSLVGCGKKESGSSGPGAHPGSGTVPAGKTPVAKKPVFIPPPGGIPAPRPEVGAPAAAAEIPAAMREVISTPEWIKRVETATQRITETSAIRATNELKLANENPAFLRYDKDRTAVEQDASLSPPEKSEKLTQIAADYQAAEAKREAGLEDPRIQAEMTRLLAKLRQVSMEGPRVEIADILEKLAVLGDKASAKQCRMILDTVDKCRQIHPRVSGPDTPAVSPPPRLPTQIPRSTQ